MELSDKIKNNSQHKDVGLEERVNKMTSKKILVFGDLHIPFVDNKAYGCIKDYMSSYKPDTVVINGDLVDFYNISFFDKNPNRKIGVQSELDLAKDYLKDLRNTVSRKTEMYLLSGNHENRLERWLWKDPEIYDMLTGYVNMKNLLDLDKLNIKYIGVTGDYWKKDNGHLILGDMLITHGDNRLNGTSTSKYAGYSVKNSMMNLQHSLVQSHVHRQAIIYHSTPHATLIGLETGCLCQLTGTANWQQGFITFETIGELSVNHRIHHIRDGILYEDGKIYRNRGKNPKNINIT